MAHKSNHADWTTKNIGYDCTFVDADGKPCDPPQAVWDAGKQMNRLWNGLYFRFRDHQRVEELRAMEEPPHNVAALVTDYDEAEAQWLAALDGKHQAKMALKVGSKADASLASAVREAEVALNATREPLAEHFAALVTMAKLIHDQEEVARKAAEKDKPGDTLTEAPKRFKPTLRGEARGNHYQPLLDSLYTQAMTYAGQLPQPCYANVATRFGDTVRKWLYQPQKFAAPRFKPVMRSIRLTYKDVGGGKPATLYENDGGMYAGVRDTLALKPLPGQEPTKEYMCNGYFQLGTLRHGERINLHVAYDRPLPGCGHPDAKNPPPIHELLRENALVKEVFLSGRQVNPFGWEWKLVFSVQAPFPIENGGKGIFALDLGWRRLYEPDGVLLGVIYDGQETHEIALPLDLTTKRAAKRKGFGKEDHWTPHNTWKLEAEMGVLLEECKTKLRAADKSGWPAAARRKMNGIVKMRDQGLFDLRYLLGKAGITEAAIEEWIEKTTPLFRKNRAIELQMIRSRDYLYRCAADGIARQARVVILDNLKIKEKATRPKRKKEARKAEFAETGIWPERSVEDRIEENAGKYRQHVSLGQFRLYLKEACAKHGVLVIEQSHDNLCSECGEPIRFEEAYAAACSNGHWRQKNPNSAIDLWNNCEEDKVGAGPLRLDQMPEQALRIIRPARTPSDD